MKEGRELAVAMSASLHETKGKAAKERPLPGRKKVLCAQKDPEPPPGFVKQRHNNSEVKGGGEKQNIPVQSAAVAMEDKREAVAKGVAKGPEEKWPSLSATHEHDSDVVTAKEHAAESSSPPPVTPPPGYAKIIRPTKAPSSAVAKLSKKSGGVATLSSKGFPPLFSESKADTPGSALSAKNSGGSKVFEDIRKALDYNKEKFKSFQTLSGWFRGGEMPLVEYSTRCEGLFGPQWWAEIGPLVAKAMPHGEKREELLVLFGGRATSSTSSSKQKSKKSSKAKKGSTPSAWTGGSGGELEEQSWRVQGRGKSNHAVSEEEYPSLSEASKLPQPPKTQNNAWNVSVHT